MTLEQAVRIVESIARYFKNNLRVEEGEQYSGSSAEALALVLAAAKKPRVYVLGEEERKKLRRLAAKIDERAHDCEHYDPGAADVMRFEAEAVRSALALEKPEEPFTVAEAEDLRGTYCCHSNYDGDAAILAKLDAYIERLAKANTNPRP